MAALAACHANGGPSSARIVISDGGSAEVELGPSKAELPRNDFKGARPPEVVQDEGARRLAYVTSSGQERVLYVVGNAVFVGPLVASPIDFQAVPGVDHALGPLFETAVSRRAELVREVRAERGDAGVVRLLLDAAYVDDPVWDQARKELPAASQASLRRALTVGLEPGRSETLLRRAVALVNLGAHTKLVTKRASELASTMRDPRVAAVLLRATIANDRAKAAEIGCDVLARRATSPAHNADASSLYEAATLAIAAADAPCDDPKLLESFVTEPCLPYFRCGETGPVSWSDASRQDEPSCTPPQLAAALAAELRREPRDVLAGGATRPALWAYAQLVARDRVPASFVAAQARRRYALSQPSGPACDRGLAPGTPCRCDEATLRLYACREATTSHVHVGVCGFSVDDARKTIDEVAAVQPP